MFLQNLPIRKKLLFLLLNAVLFIGAVGYMGYMYTKQTAQNSASMYQDRLLPIKWLGQYRINNRAIDADLLEMIQAEDSKNVRLDMQIKLNENDQLLASYGNTRLDPFEQENLQKLQSSYQQFLNEIKKVSDLSQHNRNSEAYDYYFQTVKSTRDEVNRLANALGDYNEKVAAQLQQDNLASLESAISSMITIIIVTIIVCSFVGWRIARTIIIPLNELHVLMDHARAGNFTKRSTYRSKDELGLLLTAFNQMCDDLQRVIKNVVDTSDMVASSSQELTASAEETNHATEHITLTMQQVALGSEKQVYCVEETAKTIQDMCDGIQQIADRAQIVATTASAAASKAVEGNDTIAKAILQMNSTNQVVSGLAKSIKGLGDRSKEIENIIDVITAISTQTNLLALNAAIEAARAGEYGRGFAVVADEVRKLAVQSADSAQLISVLIGSIQAETREAVQTMTTATAAVEAGISLVNSAGASFGHIQQAVSEVASEIVEVCTKAQQMAANTEQTLDSVALISEVAEEAVSGTQNVSASTEEQLASMEDITSSATALSKLAVDLRILIGKFRV